MMIASNMNLSTLDRFYEKSEAVRDLYRLLLGELMQIGLVREIKKETSISFENRKAFALAIIRDRSIKLVFRTDHKISGPRIRKAERVAARSFDHTVFLETKRDIDAELLKWLREAYENGG